MTQRFNIQPIRFSDEQRASFRAAAVAFKAAFEALAESFRCFGLAVEDLRLYQAAERAIMAPPIRRKARREMTTFARRLSSRLDLQRPPRDFLRRRRER